MLRSEVLQQPISYHYDLWLPGTPDPLLVCLHGYGQNRVTSLRFGQSVRRDWPLAALQAPHAHHLRHSPASKVGFSWVSSSGLPRTSPTTTPLYGTLSNALTPRG